MFANDFAKMYAEQQKRHEQDATALAESDNGIFRIDDEVVTFSKNDIQLSNAVIGRGSYSDKVEKGVYMPRNLTVAVKIMQVIDQGEQKHVQASMIEEAKVAKRVTHENVVQLYGFVIEGVLCYMAMELMTANLDEIKKVVHIHNKQSHERIESFLGCTTVAVVDALTFLRNEARVMHRDLKPNNIMVNELGEVKLCDFGVSKKLQTGLSYSRAHTDISQTGCLFYLAPERFAKDSKEKGYGSKAEVWSLGITLVEITHGQRPYPDATHYFISEMIVNDEAPTLKRNLSSVEFRNFVNACLIKEESRRDGLVGNKRLQDKKFYKKHASIERSERCKNVMEILELTKPLLNTLRNA